MKDINYLFFELVRVAISVQETFTRPPSIEEWMQLYNMVKKQSLVGICFAGVQQLPDTMRPPEMLYLKWMGMAAKIQQRNEVVNRQCVELSKRLKAEGYSYAILKGQGVGQLYAEHLHGLRQSGDIDVLMWKDGLTQKENREEVVKYAKSIDCNAHDAEHHIAMEMFPNTEVEMHFCPSYLCNPFANKRMQKWFYDYDKSQFVETKLGFCMPDAEYNLVFMLSHTFRHYMSEGVGLRQLMDYYFILRTLQVRGERLEVTELLNSLNMLKFAGAVMWVMKEVFGMSEQFMICEPNERLGKKLLAHIMQGGNFGHHNNKTIANKKSHWGRFVNQVAQDLILAKDYPCEALWAPLSMIREFVRIRT